MGYTKASISRAVSLLRKEGLLLMEHCGELKLTDAGLSIAAKVFERHEFFRQRLINAGVDSKTAEEEACRMEHTISEDSFKKLKEHLLLNRE